MQITVDADRIIGSWPHVERYQNTTLRYTPDGRFPEVLEHVIGKPEIIRLFVTLDEVWDFRTDQYDWDYPIGVNRYGADPRHYHYDWPLTVPSPLNIHEEEYLTSHAAHAGRVLLNIRRYEREVIDGTVSEEKYEEVLTRVLRHYKQLCPNVEYIELCNEVELENFGGLSMPEYYRLYRHGCNAVAALNQECGYPIPLKIGGFGMAFGVSHWDCWQEFLTLLSRDEQRRIDFYSFHEYHMDPQRILEFCARHDRLIHELGLPELPLFMTEYGMRTGVGDKGRPHNLQNACGEIPGMILGARCRNLKMFPWCSFHNPRQQLGRTMFVQNGAGEYIPTPSGHTMTMFSLLGDRELWIEEYTASRCIATKKNDSSVWILASNPGENSDELEVYVKGLIPGAYQVKQYLVDSCHNNCLMDPQQSALQATAAVTIRTEGAVMKKIAMEGNAFCLLSVSPVCPE